MLSRRGVVTATSHAVAPGECLREWIEEHGVSLQRVAGLMGCSRERVSGIINGRAPVAIDTAIRLECLVGVPVDSGSGT